MNPSPHSGDPDMPWSPETPEFPEAPETPELPEDPDTPDEPFSPDDPDFPEEEPGEPDRIDPSEPDLPDPGEPGTSTGWRASATPAGEGDSSADEPQGTDGAAETDECTITGGDPALQQAVVAAIKTCYDPEIPIDIYDLGLIYAISIEEDNAVAIDMTLTSPNCPVAGTLPGEVEQTVAAVDGVTDARVSIVWDPPWGPHKMTEAARLDLGLW
jgi:FeS assembly SUF system protein